MNKVQTLCEIFRILEGYAEIEVAAEHDEIIFGPCRILTAGELSQLKNLGCNEYGKWEEESPDSYMKIFV